MLQSSIGYDAQVQILTPDEEGIVTRWLKPRSRASVAHLREAMRRLGVVREPTDLFTALDAAVAKIVLLPVERRLPQWWARCVKEPSKILVGRRYTDPDRKLLRKVNLSPILLFSINWASSGPGFDWPEAYHLTWLPTHSRFIVTSSADSDDCFGYCDFALGSVVAGGNATASACAVIAKNWRLKRRLFNQPPWAHVVKSGTVKAAVAKEMAKGVWRNFVVE
jgi:hypothetical protein